MLRSNQPMRKQPPYAFGRGYSLAHLIWVLEMLSTGKSTKKWSEKEYGGFKPIKIDPHKKWLLPLALKMCLINSQTDGIQLKKQDLRKE